LFQPPWRRRWLCFCAIVSDPPCILLLVWSTTEDEPPRPRLLFWVHRCGGAFLGLGRLSDMLFHPFPLPAWPCTCRVGGNDSPLFNGTLLSFALPAIVALVGDTDAASTEGGDVIVIRGRNFGPVGAAELVVRATGAYGEMNPRSCAVTGTCSGHRGVRVTAARRGPRCTPACV
jgi:hypothetical protein